MRVDLRHLFDRTPNELEIVLERKCRIHPTLKQYCCHTVRSRLLHFLNHVINAVRVFTFIPRMPVERTENTVNIANIRVVRICISNKCDPRFGVLCKPNFTGTMPQFQELRVAKKKEPFLTRDPIALVDSVKDLFECHGCQRETWYPEAFNSLRMLRLASSNFTTIGLSLIPGTFLGKSTSVI